MAHLCVIFVFLKAHCSIVEGWPQTLHSRRTPSLLIALRVYFLWFCQSPIVLFNDISVPLIFDERFESIMMIGKYGKEDKQIDCRMTTQSSTNNTTIMVVISLCRRMWLANTPAHTMHMGATTQRIVTWCTIT